MEPKRKGAVQMPIPLLHKLKELQMQANFYRMERTALSCPALLELLMRFIEANCDNPAEWLSSQETDIVRPRGRVSENGSR